MAVRVLRDLGLVAAEETPSADDQTFTEETVESVYAELAAVGISLPDGNDQALPEKHLVCLAKRIGLDVAPAFGLISISDAELAKPVAERRLRALAMRPATGQVAPADYF